MVGAFRFVTTNVVVLLFIIKLLAKVIEPVLIKVPPCPVMVPELDPTLFPFPIDNVPEVRVNPPENVLTPVSVTVHPLGFAEVVEPEQVPVPPVPHPVVTPQDGVQVPQPDASTAVQVPVPAPVHTHVLVQVPDVAASITTAPGAELELSAIIPEYVEGPLIVSTPGNAMALDPVPVLNPKTSFPEPEMVEAVIPTRSNVVVPLVKFKALINLRELLEVVIVPPVLVIVPVPT